MSSNLTSSVHGTPSDAASGLTLIEEYLDKKLLEEGEIQTPLAQSGYGDERNIPKMAGQFAKFTKRKKLRLPEKATEGSDPSSYASLAYEQMLAPIEFWNDHTAISTISSMTSWLELAKDYKELTFEAIRRFMNRQVQAGFLMGRAQPGARGADGSASTPFYTAAEATATLWGLSFSFKAAPSYFANRKAKFSDLDPMQDFLKMDDFRRLRVILGENCAPTIEGKYVAVISEAIQADLERDEEYFAAAIRNPVSSKKMFAGEIADYAGFKWVLDAEPYRLGTKSSVKLVENGPLHVAQVFGKNAFAYLRLGGEKGAKPGIKVQDISTTGSLTTMGYLFPFQSLITNENWCANLIAPVRDVTNPVKG
ncbi:MAG: hypothetical protein EOM20_03290 [Spartobacteria bacterium]|nr:hypothetical protein [Spartobacteria bacterium]